MQIEMKLYIIAGEKSGDIHGALLLKNLLRLMPGMEAAGLGGQGMARVMSRRGRLGG